VPGCGTFPVLAGLLLAAMSLALMLRSFIAPAVFFNFLALPRNNILVLLGTLAAMAAHLFLWRYMGYVAGTILTIMALGVIFRVKWTTLLPFSLAMGFGTDYLFREALHIILELG
jgi:hypothetical protein